MLDRIWIWFADNGNIRKWQREPFEEGTEFVSTVTPAEVGGLVEELQTLKAAFAAEGDNFGMEVSEAFHNAASLIQSQAAGWAADKARIAALEKALTEIVAKLRETGPTRHPMCHRDVVADEIEAIVARRALEAQGGPHG